MKRLLAAHDLLRVAARSAEEVSLKKSRSQSPPLIVTLSSMVGGARERGPPKMSTQGGAKLLKTEAVEFKNKKREGFCVAVRHKC